MVLNGWGGIRGHTKYHTDSYGLILGPSDFTKHQKLSISLFFEFLGTRIYPQYFAFRPPPTIHNTFLFTAIFGNHVLPKNKLTKRKKFPDISFDNFPDIKMDATGWTKVSVNYLFPFYTPTMNPHQHFWISSHSDLLATLDFRAGGGRNAKIVIMWSGLK